MKSEPSKNSPPLSPAILHILLALAERDLHGYGILQEISRHSEGHYRMGPGTLYDNLKKLLDTGIVTESLRTDEDSSEERRIYSLSAQGKAVLSSEVERLQHVIDEARLRLGVRKPKRA